MIQAKTGRIPNAIDVRYEPLYDTYKVASGVTLAGFTNRFFATPVGGAITLSDTNMTNAAQLPVPNAFLVKGIKIEASVHTTADFALLVKLIKGAYLRFFVGTKDYLTIPLAQAAGKITCQTAGGKSDGTEFLAYQQIGAASENGYQFADNRYVKIASGENFGVDIVADATIVAHTLAADCKIRCYLEGVRYIEVR
jgi:hypothetical protein